MDALLADLRLNNEVGPLTYDEARSRLVAIQREAVTTLLDAHRPSLTDSDDETITRARFDLEVENADLALRTCSCGASIDGFDEYVAHLRKETQA